MHIKKLLLIGLAALATSNTQAANQNFNVKYNLAIMEDGQLRHKPQRQFFGFRVEILNDDEGVKPETYINGRPSITASKGERYSVRLYNPLPVRVAVNLTVDGLNSISGQPSGITDGNKWLIEPYGSIIIPGWQVTGGESRRFFFTEKPKSYAKWRGDETDKDLSANCGVIGAAYFWNQEELNQYYDNHPICRYSQNYSTDSHALALDNSFAKMKCFPSRSARASNDAVDFQSAAAPAPQAQVEAGTGMGETQSHPTTQVDFSYDTGMYSLDQAVVIYYDFAKVHAPNPFPAVGYAPEMP